MSTDFLFFTEVISKQQEQDFLTQLLQLPEKQDDASSSSIPTSSWTYLKRRRLILAGACPSQQQDKNSMVFQTPIPSFITGDILTTVNQKLSETKEAKEFCDEFGILLPLQHAQSESADKNKLNILINEYQAPNGILFHTDGPAYQPCVCIISMESTIPIIFTPNEVPSIMKSSQDRQASSSIYDDDDEDDDDQSENDDAINDDDWKNWMKRSVLISKFAKYSDLSSAHLQDARLAHPNSFAVLLPPRSMIVFSGSLYTNYLHGILENQLDVLPVDKVANIDAGFLINSTSHHATVVVDFPVNLPKTSVVCSDEREKKLFQFLTFLAQIKSLDRVEMMQKKDLTSEIQKRKRELLDMFGEKDGDFFVMLSKSATEKYLLSVRQERRISLTYRRVA